MKTAKYIIVCNVLRDQGKIETTYLQLLTAFVFNMGAPIQSKPGFFPRISLQLSLHIVSSTSSQTQRNVSY